MESVVERFLRYVTFDTQSDEESDTCPSTEKQKALAAALVEEVRAAAGIDIGGTLIGMHLKRVAVPVRLTIKQIGAAPIICARTRPKYIGGSRAVYQEM